MHEATVAASILRIVKDEAARHGIYGPDTPSLGERAIAGVSVAGIDLQVGLLAGIEAQTLSGCFAFIAEGTVADGAQLDIHVLPMQGHCPNCNETVNTNKRAFACPHCQGLDVRWQGGNELSITGIRIRETIPAPDRLATPACPEANERK